MKFDIQEEKPTEGLEGFVEEFYNDRIVELEKMHQSLNNEDFEGLRQLAHKWKGFSDPYGFQTLTYLSKQLEQSSASKDKASSVEILAAIDEYLRQKAQFI